jgi:hypothetical protein
MILKSKRLHKSGHGIPIQALLQDSLASAWGLQYASSSAAFSGVRMRFPLFLAALIPLAQPLFSENPAPVSASPTAAAATPQAQSPTASAIAASPTAEPEPDVQDDAETVSFTAQLDLSKASSSLLAKISETLKKEDEKILYNVEDNAAAEKPGPGVNEVEALALYAELAKRTLAEDKEARQALTLAALRGDKRAIEAKNEAFAEKIAGSLIKRYENGDGGAKDELMKLALKGNARARAYLKLDAAPVAVNTPESLSPSAVPTSATAK